MRCLQLSPCCDLISDVVTPLQVKWWITFNEPAVSCSGYANYGGMAPSMPAPGIGDYLAAHTIIKSHARAYHIYDQEFRPTQQGRISITLNSDWNEPASASQEDVDAATRARDFYLNWFAHPIYSLEGDYPAVMRERVDALSAQEGRPRSRLPSFTAEEVASIRGTADFFGLNSYSTQLMSNCEYGDSGTCSSFDPSWPGSASSWLKVVPWGLRRLVNWVTANYPGYPIIITENGFSDLGDTDDVGRVDYVASYLRELAGAINEDGANVIGYTLWSLIDNLEWDAGYTQRFGINHVDFEDPARPRTPKSSHQLYKDIIASRQVPSADQLRRRTAM